MSIEIKDLENIDKKEINISDLSSNEIEMIELNGLINIPLIKGDKGDTGKDGYTPIKGIDYFDGQNGINGENGKDGADGQNGYTPIKGEDYFTEEEIQEIKSNILDQVNQFSVLVVEKLPTENIDDHTIYFVPKTKAEQDDVYDEYIYINNGWEHIGTTEVDLSSYYKKDEIDAKLSEVEGNEVFVGKAEEAPETAKIIVEDEDFEEGAGLSKSEVYIGPDEPSCGEKVWLKKDENSIYVRNSNGIYEEFIKKQEEKYSTEEQKIGRWIDGKPLYRKVVDFGNLPNATLKNVSHQISNLDTVIDVKGISQTTDNTFSPIPFSSGINLTGNIQITINNTAIFIRTGQDKSSETAIIIIEYTKTTD